MGEGELTESSGLEWSLLDHNGLLTPVLIVQFGPITAEKVSTDFVGSSVMRRLSRLHQATTGAVILDAEMILSTAALPKEVLTGLQETVVPFGQLLIDAGISARSVDRQILRLQPLDGGESRLCRQHRLINTRSGQELCKVVETLSTLSILKAAQKAIDRKEWGQ